MTISEGSFSVTQVNWKNERVHIIHLVLAALVPTAGNHGATGYRFVYYAAGW